MRYLHDAGSEAAAGKGLTFGRRNDVLQTAIAITAELCGRGLSLAAVELLSGDLAKFDEHMVLAALRRCRLELQGVTLKISDILIRLPDGRPGVDAAWSMMPATEAVSVVWTEEMAQVWGQVQPMIEANQIESARSVFYEAYELAVLKARVQGKAVHWIPSLGSDPAGREAVLLEALQLKRLAVAHVRNLLPAWSLPASDQHTAHLALVGNS